MGRPSLVDTPSGAGLFRDAVLAHARLGEMLLVTARIGDALVGYALCFVDRDGDMVRVWTVASIRHGPTTGSGRSAAPR